jgi:hypothetical protein
MKVAPILLLLVALVCPSCCSVDFVWLATAGFGAGFVQASVVTGSGPVVGSQIGVLRESPPLQGTIVFLDSDR